MPNWRERSFATPALSCGNAAIEVQWPAIDSAQDAVPVYLFAKEKSDSDWIGYTATVGLGRITVLPANIAAAQFASDDAARALLAIDFGGDG